MDVLQLLTSAVVGAVFGAVASIATASRVALAHERAKGRESARLKVLAEARFYRAAVAGSTGRLSMGRGPKVNPLTDEAARKFAERIIRASDGLSTRQYAALLDRLKTLVGTVPTLVSEEVAYLPDESRAEQWKAEGFLRVANRVPDVEKLSHGLIGKAHRSDERRRDDGAVAELDALVADLGG